MALHPAERATLHAFVVPAKRDRLLALFGSPKRRRRALDVMNHFADWDLRFAQTVDSSANALAMLRGAGAPAECHVIADGVELDGRDMPLAEAVRACESHPFASVLCCVPGRLAFYFDEAASPRIRVILRRDRDPAEHRP